MSSFPDYHIQPAQLDYCGQSLAQILPTVNCVKTFQHSLLLQATVAFLSPNSFSHALLTKCLVAIYTNIHVVPVNEQKWIFFSATMLKDFWYFSPFPSLLFYSFLPFFLLFPTPFIYLTSTQSVFVVNRCSVLPQPTYCFFFPIVYRHMQHRYSSCWHQKSKWHLLWAFFIFDICKQEHTKISKSEQQCTNFPLEVSF